MSAAATTELSAARRSPSLPTFFDNLDSFAETPEGVAKLRELVLDLAVRGKLIEQAENQEPASKLLERVEAERTRLVKEGKLRKRKTPPPPTPDEIPHNLPNGWEWTRLSIIGEVGPRNDVDDATVVSFLPMATVSDGYAGTIEPEVRTWGEIKKGFTHVADGDIAMAKITPCFQNRKSAVMRGLKNGVGAGTTELHVLRPIDGAIVPEYALLQLKSLTYLEVGVSKMTGSAGQKRVPKDYFADTPFPLPPLSEQRRIVSKVDGLMSLCDELESRSQERVRLRERASRSCLDRLVNAPRESERKGASPRPDRAASRSTKPAASAVPLTESLSSAWQRLADHFEVLYDTPETLAHLRQSILRLAVQGKLVPQHPNDEPAEKLAARIAEAKKRQIEKTSIRNTSSVPPVDDETVPYPAQQGWKWTRLGDFGVLLGGGTPSKTNAEYWDGPIPWVSPKDMKRPYIDDATDHVSEVGIDNSSARMIPTGSLLMVIRGMILVHSFPVAISQRPLAINQDMKALALAQPDVTEWLLLVCQAAKSRMLENVLRSSHGTCRIDSDSIAEFPVPLPPLAEQKRIVAKVDQLLSQCDELSARLRERQSATQQLLTATINQILTSSAV